MMQLPEVELTIYEVILARHSVRNYKAQEVDQATIRILLEAAVRAPTAMHQEPWAFVIIQDKQLLQNLSDRAKPLFLTELVQKSSEPSGHMLDNFKNPDFNIFYNAGTLILICSKKATPSFTADCWLAAENLMLAACAMGFGTCVIGSALPAFNVSEVKKQLRIPDKFSVVAPIILGYPDEALAPTLRKNPLILTSICAT